MEKNGNENMSVVERSFTQTTRTELIKLRYVWNITNFSFRPEPCGTALDSAFFNAKDGASTNAKWFLKIHPKGKDNDRQKWMSFYLALDTDAMDTDASTSLVKWKWALLNEQKEEKACKELQHVFDQTTPDFGYSQYIKFTELCDPTKRLLPNDTLSIVCELSYVDGQTEEIVDNSKPSPIAVAENQLSVNFGSVFENGPFSDCMLVAGDTTFPVHTVLLAARSDVFAAMFSHELKENCQRLITITDFDHEVVCELLRFIYTGGTPKLSEMAEPLYCAADKYQLGRLKQMCERAVCDALSVDNVCDALLLAHAHGAEQLMAHAKRFMKINLDAIMKTEEWKCSLQKHPDLFLSTFTSSEFEIQRQKRAKNEGNTANVERTFTQTQTTTTELTKLRYVWKITNFSFRPESCGTVLKSATFSASDGEKKAQWCLKMYPKGINEDNKDSLSVYLRWTNNDEASIVNWRLAILNAKMDEKKGQKMQSLFNGETPENSTPNQFVTLTELFDPTKGLLPNDTLSIVCEISFIDADTEEIVKKSRPSSVVVAENQLSADFGSLFENGQLSDCMLVAGDTTFRVHTLVLAARSEVFATMFSHPMQETCERVITITDFDYEVVRELLRFIYTGDTPKLSEMAVPLRRAADKYKLPRLKQMCERALCDALTVDNVCDTLLLADTEQLKEHAKHFLKINLDAVMKTEEWKNSFEKNPNLFQSVFSVLADRALQIS